MAERKIRRPKKSEVAPEPATDNTYPGDTIHVSMSGEFKNALGQSIWPKVGITTTHREGETTADVMERAVTFVAVNLQAFAGEMK